MSNMHHFWENANSKCALQLLGVLALLIRSKAFRRNLLLSIMPFQIGFIIAGHLKHRLFEDLRVLDEHSY